MDPQDPHAAARDACRRAEETEEAGRDADGPQARGPLPLHPGTRRVRERRPGRVGGRVRCVGNPTVHIPRHGAPGHPPFRHYRLELGWARPARGRDGLVPGATTRNIQSRQPLSKERSLEIKRNDTRPSSKGPADYFTGTVHVEPLFQAPAPARVRGATSLSSRRPHRLAHAPARPDPDRYSRFRSGSAFGRSNRGNPPRGRGLVSARREALAWCSPKTAMTHIAIQEALDGKTVEWLEKVSDEQYGG